jgi:hypothetical protein
LKAAQILKYLFGIDVQVHDDNDTRSMRYTFGPFRNGSLFEAVVQFDDNICIEDVQVCSAFIVKNLIF